MQERNHRPKSDEFKPPHDSPVTFHEVAAIYAELRPVAVRLLRSEPREHWIQATSLVNATLSRIIGKDWRQRAWKNRGHFFEEFARNMRWVLVDYARQRARRPRLTLVDPVAFDDVVTMYCDRPEQLVEIDDLIERMSVAEDLYESERKARVAEQLIFGGLTVAEVAQMMGVGEATIKRDWVAIKAWFATRLGLADPSRHRVDRDDV